MADMDNNTSGGLTFQEWKRDVNRELARTSGLTADDLPDFDYYNAWADGESAADAAREVLEEADFPFDDDEGE